ncbi:MAG: hypothetical protein F6K00_35040 [Leptolyngbya sp. SIOISBB]|nr:hypothetical protein [Leptolyngbya sp. SIOISBB]
MNVLELLPKPRQTCCVSRSFGRPVTKLAELREAIATHTAKAAYKLRKDNLAASVLSVFIATNRHRPDAPYYRNTATVDFPSATNDAIILTKAALRALEPLYRVNDHYQKAGVWLAELSPTNQSQQDLFIPSQDQAKARRRMRVRCSEPTVWGGDAALCG